MEEKGFSLRMAGLGEKAGITHNPEFDQYLIAPGDGWNLYLHPNLRYLGRAYLWSLHHSDLDRLSRLAPHWLTALMACARAYEEALHQLWRPDHMNYTWLGNEVEAHRGHGHLHLIPRYATPRRFGNRTYVDENWGRNPSPCNRVVLSAAEIAELVATLRQALKKDSLPRTIRAST
jgi:diadenosine tetraphosphate (Ap4A) HIT family hydrolase